MKISVIVTNWNGLPLLKKHFLDVIKNSPEAKEIIFTDDASQDGSVEYISSLKTKYPQIKIIRHQKNIGFAKNSNYAAQKAYGDFLVFLNNDITPLPGYIKNSLKLLQTKEVFGAGFAEKDHENWAKIFWADGYLQHQPGTSNLTSVHRTAWLSGGSSIIKKSEFLRLGGFDPIYEPFYSEDLDLGYRAWKSGYQLLWNPQSVVIHKHESTMSKFPKRFSDYVKERNRLLNVWRCITDPSMLTQNRLTQITRVLFGPNYIKIILAARRQLKKSPPSIVYPVLTDRQIFDLFSHD